MCPKFVPVSSPIVPRIIPSLARSYQLTSFDGPAQMDVIMAPPPAINMASQVLVKVKAASVNPLDVMMSRGYGRRVLGSIRELQGLVLGSDQKTFPIVLGRDFSGEVVSVGQGVTRVKVGDTVWGATFPSTQGTHQDYCLADQDSVAIKPTNLSHVEAASLPFAGLTAWAAISQVKCVSNGMGRFRRAIVFGAGGGVGSIATQLLARYYNCDVVGVASKAAHSTVKSYGASDVLDYSDPDYQAHLSAMSPQDLVVDCAGLGEGVTGLARLLRPGGRIISLTSPVLSSTDKAGVVGGTVLALSELVRHNFSTIHRGNLVTWGFFLPSTSALQVMAGLIENGLLVPPVTTVYNFDKIEEAYAQVDEGRSNGKVVVQLTD